MLQNEATVREQTLVLKPNAGKDIVSPSPEKVTVGTERLKQETERLKSFMSKKRVMK